MSRPLVSVILTSYNKPDMLKQAICSVIAQTYENWELIIIDDLSDLSVLNGIIPLEELATNMRVFNTDLGSHEKPEKLNRYAHNINLAVKEWSNGELITYLCDDDLYNCMRLETMVSYLEQNPEAKIVCGKQLAIGYGRCFIRGVEPIIHQAAMKIDHSSVMHWRECFDKVVGWEEGPETIRYGDAAFWRKLNRFWPFHGIEEILDVHRFSDLSVNASENRVVLGVEH